MVEQPFTALGLWRDLGQPNCSFDGFHLTKEWADAAERVVPPVLEQARGFRADLPLVGVRQGPPHIHVLTHFIDEGVDLIFTMVSTTYRHTIAGM